MFFVSSATRFVYQKAAKPLLFRRDPERVHDATVRLARTTARVGPMAALLRMIWACDNEILHQTVCGIDFHNPIGLAGGFDKNAELTDFMPVLGFGFLEVGSITALRCDGNPGKRLWRLPKSKSLLVYYGLKNDGVDAIARRLSGKKFCIPIGTNIAKTNNKDCANDERAIDDYAYSFRVLADIGDYFTVNISCPNTYGGQPFTDKKTLHALLTELDKIPTNKPIFIKLSPDLTAAERKGIAELSLQHRVDGFICTNLTKPRSNPRIKDDMPSGNGGMSGAVVKELSDKLVFDMYALTHGKKVIIGCGGVFTAEDAYEKIKQGATLVQMVTGLIYEGPQVVGQINKGLVTLLRRDGFANITQAVGVNHVPKNKHLR